MSCGVAMVREQELAPVLSKRSLAVLSGYRNILEFVKQHVCENSCSHDGVKWLW